VTDSQKCIMVVGAHAADAEIMGGATVLKHVAAGWRAVMAHMTGGEKGHPKLSPEDYLVIKRGEAAQAAAILGAACEMLPYPDGELPVNEAAQWAVADLIRRYRPGVILTHWKGSFHRDHRNTYTNVLESLFYAGLPAFRREYPPHRPDKVYFAENWEDEEDFQAQLYLDVTDVWDNYIEAIHAYSLFRGEVVAFPYEQWYRGASEMRGAEAGCKRAVALMVPSSFYGVRHSRELLGE